MKSETPPGGAVALPFDITRYTTGALDGKLQRSEPPRWKSGDLHPVSAKLADGRLNCPVKSWSELLALYDASASPEFLQTVLYYGMNASTASRAEFVSRIAFYLDMANYTFFAGTNPYPEHRFNENRTRTSTVMGDLFSWYDVGKASAHLAKTSLCRKSCLFGLTGQKSQKLGVPVPAWMFGRQLEDAEIATLVLTIGRYFQVCSQDERSGLYNISNLVSYFQQGPIGSPEEMAPHTFDEPRLEQTIRDFALEFCNVVMGGLFINAVSADDPWLASAAYDAESPQSYPKTRAALRSLRGQCVYILAALGALQLVMPETRNFLGPCEDYDNESLRAICDALWVIASEQFKSPFFAEKRKAVGDVATLDRVCATGIQAANLLRMLIECSQLMKP